MRLAIETTPLPVLIAPPGAIAMELNISVYDALYLALVERIGAPMVSDHRMISAGSRTARFKDKVVWIGDFAA